jgi:hypothetical protein
VRQGGLFAKYLNGATSVVLEQGSSDDDNDSLNVQFDNGFGANEEIVVTDKKKMFLILNN